MVDRGKENSGRVLGNPSRSWVRSVGYNSLRLLVVVMLDGRGAYVQGVPVPNFGSGPISSSHLTVVRTCDLGKYSIYVQF